jgi:thymidylate synthase
MQIICTEKLRWKLQYQHGRIHSYSNAAPIVLHEAFSYERYTMGDVVETTLQWRSYKGEAIAYNSDNNSFIYERHDQIKELIADMRENIMSTRLKVASWNPSEINKTASSMSRQFQVIGVPLFDNEMIALAGKNGANISK